MRYDRYIDTFLKKSESRAFSGLCISANEKLIKAGLTEAEMHALVVDLNIHLIKNGGNITRRIVSSWMKNRIKTIQLLTESIKRNL